MIVTDLLAHEDCNIFGVDWSDLVGLDYFAAAQISLKVGTHIGAFLAKFGILGLEGNNIHVIGHSLGAQASGHLGREFQRVTGFKIGRISGLDPAKPLFDIVNESVRLNKNDAIFVDIMHTNSGNLEHVRYK